MQGLKISEFEDLVERGAKSLVALGESAEGLFLDEMSE